jgi:hypothetical protein
MHLTQFVTKFRGCVGRFLENQILAKLSSTEYPLHGKNGQRLTFMRRHPKIKGLLLRVDISSQISENLAG